MSCSTWEKPNLSYGQHIYAGYDALTLFLIQKRGIQAPQETGACFISNFAYERRKPATDVQAILGQFELDESEFNDSESESDSEDKRGEEICVELNKVNVNSHEKIADKNIGQSETVDQNENELIIDVNDKNIGQAETVDQNENELIIDVNDHEYQQFLLDNQQDAVDNTKTSRIMIHHSHPYSIDLEGRLIKEFIPERFGDIMGLVTRIACFRTETAKYALGEFITVHFQNMVDKATIRTRINQIKTNKTCFYFQTKIYMSVYSNHLRNRKKINHHGKTSREKRSRLRREKREREAKEGEMQQSPKRMRK